MRYYLDTNILAFLLLDRQDEFCPDVAEILLDYGTIRLTSSVCVHELMHLFQIGRLDPKGKRNFRCESVLDMLDIAGIDIVPVNRKHLEAYANLPMHGHHTDPNDRLIVAQSIADRIPVISSEHQFKLYQKDQLQFVFNVR